jgi:hypothetical protein
MAEVMRTLASQPADANGSRLDKSEGGLEPRNEIGGRRRTRKITRKTTKKRKPSRKITRKRRRSHNKKSRKH